MCKAKYLRQTQGLLADCMEKRSQGAFEYLTLLAAVMIVVGAIVVIIGVVSASLGSSVGSQIDNVRENIIIPGLVGMLLS